MSSLGDMIDDMWDEAGHSGPGTSPGCMVAGTIIFFAFMIILIYFMK